MINSTVFVDNTKSNTTELDFLANRYVNNFVQTLGLIH